MAQLQTTQGRWDAAETLVLRNMEHSETAGGYAALLSYHAALSWVRHLFTSEALATRTAQRAFVLLRDLTTCFLHCTFIQQALVSTLPQNDAPSLAAAYARIGEALLAMGLLTEAKPAFSIASDLKPDDAMIHNNLAVVYWQIAEQTQEPECIRQALGHIEDALRLDPYNTEVLVNAELILSAQET